VKGRWGLVTGLLLTATVARGGMASLGVIDLPYARVWEAGLRAVEDYPLERAADGRIATGWLERAPTADEAGFQRVVERVTLLIERMADQVTRVTAVVEARGWRAGEWVLLPNTDDRAEVVLDRVARRL
jgi:hypothetical protein